MDVDPPELASPPSKKKHRDSEDGSIVEVTIDKTPTKHREKLKVKTPTSKSKSEAAPSSVVSPSPKTPSKHKAATKDDDSEDEDEAFERLRAMDANEPSKVPLRAESSSGSEDEDAPVAKSFKSARQDAIAAHHEEQDEARRVAHKEKEKRRQRAQLLQEQSKKASSKRKEKEKRKTEEEDASGQAEDGDLLPTTLLKQAASQASVAAVIDKNEEKRVEIDRKKERHGEIKKKQEDKIRSKKVNVVVLSDAQGNLQLQGRKASTQAAESFIKDHFWGSRLERMNADVYLAERQRGPAPQFTVTSPEDIATLKARYSARDHKEIKL